ncbi:MAG: glycine--tRNA ligase [Candidatus Paceibacterota bacterium]
MTNPAENSKMEEIISLAKRRGFVFQGSEIYGGLAGTWDYGPLGLALKNNIKNLWWKRFVDDREDMYGVDAAILMNQKVWQATGHVGGFADPVVECSSCKSKLRADHLLENFYKENPTIVHEAISADPSKLQGDIDSFGKEISCSKCGKKGSFSKIRQFNMMFETHVGAIQDESSISYLRPETAQGMFVNYKNIIDSFHPKLPFGMAQIGKAFRNEIAPRDFTFRAREFEQMEIEYLIKPPKGEEWKPLFEQFKDEMIAFSKDIGLDEKHIHPIEIAEADRAFYSKRTIDIEFDFPFGQKELYGLAYRTDYDLKKQGEFSGVPLDYYDEETKEKFIPHCIEPSFGLDRTVLAVLSDAYTVDEMGGEKRTYLKFNSKVAPIKIAVFPLLRNKPELVKKAREIYQTLKKEFGAVEFDDNGNIGKRYRRQDEIGTPFCLTVDFETIEENKGVTIRDRDSGKQERVAEGDLVAYIKRQL